MDTGDTAWLLMSTALVMIMLPGLALFSAIQAGYTGLLEGNAQQLVNQLIAVGATIAYAVMSTFVIVKVVDVILGIRVSASDEEMGIDLATHGEVAYQA